MAAPGLTTRQYFRQLRAADFALEAEHLRSGVPRQRPTLFRILERVDELTAAHYAEPAFWSDYPLWVHPNEAAQRQRQRE